ncbi:hypothetical protein [Agaribacterium sp. ZY112]|uniref:hypothetical protein n=1 Tax=Agaribacterium sp. ZY112 TaxID=3233574 RepID=UPI003526AD31
MKLLLALVFLFGTSSVLAASWSGEVVMIKAMTPSEAVLFQLSSELKEPARCNEHKAYAIDLSAPGGMALFDLVRHAYLNGLRVEAESLNTCAVFWKAEGVKSITLKR